MYIFLRESKILLEYAGRFIHLDTVADISCDQTFKEFSMDRRTLHNKNHFLKYRKVRANNTISGSLSLYITKSKQELLLLELAGWNNFGSGFSYPDFTSVIPETFNIYIMNPLGSYKIENCIVTAIDLSFSKTFCGAMSLSFDAAKLTETTETSVLHPQGEHLDVTPMISKLGSNDIQAISASMTFTREISYLNSENIHNSDNIISNTRAIITNANFSILLNTYLNNPVLDNTDFIHISQSGLYIELDNALITKRTNITEVCQTSFDITPTNITTYINLGGL